MGISRLAPEYPIESPNRICHLPKTNGKSLHIIVPKSLNN
jgi:hypothetical protein